MVWMKSFCNVIKYVFEGFNFFVRSCIDKAVQFINTFFYWGCGLSISTVLVTFPLGFKIHRIGWKNVSLIATRATDPTHHWTYDIFFATWSHLAVFGQAYVPNSVGSVHLGHWHSKYQLDLMCFLLVKWSLIDETYWIVISSPFIIFVLDHTLMWWFPGDILFGKMRW